MKKVLHRRIALILLVFLCVSVLASCSDPNKKLPEADHQQENPEAKSNGEIPVYIDADTLAKRSYELSFLLSQKSFDSPEQMSVSALVQFAFCHLFYADITDIPTEGMIMPNLTTFRRKLPGTSGRLILI